MKIEIIRRMAEKKQFKKNIFLGFLCLLMASGFLFFVLNPALTNAQEMNNGLENFRTHATYGNTDLPSAMGNIMRIVLGVLGLAAAVIIIMGGFRWMTSGGDETKIAGAKKLMIAGIIGILIIVLAYAIASFIMSKLSEVTEPSTYCVGSKCCKPDSCCGNGIGMKFDENCECTIPAEDTCYFSSDSMSLLLKSGEAAFSTENIVENPNAKVYRCSKIKPVFNHNLNSNEVNAVITDETLKVVKATDADKKAIEGTWKISGSSVLFTPKTIWDSDTKYNVIVPKSIKDTYIPSLPLYGCSNGFNPKYHCSKNADTVIWDFETNNIVDTEAPYLNKTYPTIDSAKPNQWVSRAPIIDLNFNESIDFDTVADADGHPISTSFTIEKLASRDAESGTAINGILIVKDKYQGFFVSLSNPNLLDPFTWYKITVANVKDLCGNPMAAPQSWKFETNDIVPGISDYWPKDKNVCPDEPIGVSFATSMYDNTVTIQGKIGKNIVFQGSIKPKEIEASVTTEDGKNTIGKIKVIDADIENISTQFKVFEIKLNNNLTVGTSYYISATTDLIMDVDQNKLGKDWDFTTTDLTKCACSPVIYKVTPDSGSRKSCVTVFGRCFTGTTNRPATITKFQFDDKYPVIPPAESRPNGEDGPINAIVESSGPDFITTVIPAVFGDPATDISDSLGVKVGITYDGDASKSETVSWDKFLVNDNSESSGPCLLSINPSSGYPKGDPSETKVSFNGLRFGTKNDGSKIIFYNQVVADFLDANWSDTQIIEVFVPADAQKGNVVVKNSSGTSNSLPFEVLHRAPKPGDKCQDVSCPNNSGSCSAPYKCLSGADTCRCCCNPKQQNSCAVGLTCLANQGNCKGPEDNPRGLCCGCKNDAQCGTGAGCGILDPNKCCYPQPIIINASKSPADGEINVCKNASVSMTFDDLMDHNSLNDNIKLLSSDVDPGYETNFEEGMVALWHFNKGAGLIVEDAKGLNDGTISGAAWVNGKFGKALEFDGALGDDGDYITIPDSSSLDLQKLTLDVFIKIKKDTSTDPDKGRLVILAKGDEGMTARNNYVLDLYRKGPNTGQWQPGFVVGTGIHPDLTNVRGSTWLSEDVFYRITATYDGENLKIYVNGKLDGIQLKTFGEKSLVNAGNLVIGRQSYADSLCPDPKFGSCYYSNFRGVIDEVRIYNKALTEEDILAPHQVKGRITSVDDNIKKETTTDFYPSGCQLNPNSTYKIWVKGGIYGSGAISKMGVSMNDTAWDFTTGDGTCRITTIKVIPTDLTVNGLNQTPTFGASALDSNGRQICVDSFNWTSAKTNIATISPSSGLSTIAKPKDFGQSLIMASTGDNVCTYTEPRTCALLTVSPGGPPQVSEESGCSECKLGDQSPSPSSQSTDACTQAQIRARFNREVVIDTTNNTDTAANKNIIIQKCGTSDFNNSGCPDNETSNIALGTFTIEKNGFYFKPAASLEKNKIYRIILKSGSNGIKDKFGLELDGDKNGVQGDDYTWMFIANNDDCPLNKICLDSAGTNQILQNETKVYTPQIYTSNCNYLESSKYSWSWDDGDADPPNIAEFVGTPNESATVKGKNLGETDITVSTTITTSKGEQPISDSSHLVVATQPTVVNSYPNGNVCRNTVIYATFDQLMDKSTLNSDTIKLYKYCPATASLEKNNIFVRFFNSLKNIFLKKAEAGKTVIYDLKADISAVDNNTTKQTIVYLNSGLGLLDASGACTYQVEISGKEEIAGKENIVKSKYGIEMAENNSWTFTTGADICKLSKVEITAEEVDEKVNPVNTDPGKPKIISPASVEFYKKDSTIKFSTKALDNKGAEIHGVSDYNWTWSWDSSKPNVVLVPISANSSQTATAQNQNGDSQIKVTAKITADTSKSDIGKSFSAMAQAKVFLCEFPWIQGGFTDSETHFRLQYCRGNLEKNLVFNGAMFDGTNGWSKNQSVDISTVKQSNYNVLKVTNKQSKSTPGVISTNWIKVSPNTQYTLSMLVNRTGTSLAYIYVQSKIASSYYNLVWPGNAISTGALAKISNTFTTGPDDTAIKVGILWTASTKEDVIHMTNIQLEKGAQPTEYQNFPSLPSLIATDTTKSNVVKEFLFTNNANNDVIGLKVLKNPDYLTPFEWYKKNVPNPGSPTSFIVNGYQAVKEGRTVYVGATNVKDDGKIEGLIYLISYSDSAKSETIDIFNQLVNNWQFNTNKTTDEQQKIQRDLFRLYDLKTINQKLTDYKSTNGYYPKLESGSFIKGMTVSKWPSWKNPQGQFISSMPNDPTNQFSNPTSGYCAGCSDTSQCGGTCYNQSTSKYECPVGSSVYQYVSISEDDYRLYLNFETDSSKWQANCGGMDRNTCETHYLCGWTTKCQQKLFGYNSDAFKCFNSVYGPIIEKTKNDPWTSEIGGSVLQ
ncbi:MAG: Ig-like domain-containing protein [Patescibacteria group bacterium]